MSEVLGIEEAIDRCELQYTKRWVLDSDMFESTGFYAEIAKSIKLRADAVHLDLGSGLGHLLSCLHETAPSAKLLGVDRNKFMLMGATNYLTELGVQVFAYFNSNISVANQMICRSFDFSPVEGIERWGESGAVSLALDDFRSMRVVSSLTTDLEITSASFVFPGTSSNGIYESPYRPARMSNELESRRIQELMNRTREAAAAYTASRLPETGRFVVVDRMAFTDSTKENVLAAMHSRMGSSQQYFDFIGSDSNLFTFGDTFKLTSSGEFAYREDAVQLRVQGPHNLADEVKVVVGVFERNDKPFDAKK